jgi:hypothetical protein
VLEKGFNLHKLLISATLACASYSVQAAEAGKIIFVAGVAQAGERAAVQGATVEEGQMLSTGADGYLYVKTADNGLFILRPQTRARIVAYHIDQQNPANTRVKFELLSGTARSRSGDAVKHARQNFRFNTPVAAIGVRGTDFTVVTDNDTSRVSVFSGGVVVSGFAAGCRPDGGGPCEGAASRELSAAQRGQLLQVTRGQAAPQVIEGGAGAPDQVSPPRPGEPVAKSSGAGDSKITVEAAKNVGLTVAISKNLTPTPTPNRPSDETTPPLMPPVVVGPPVVDVPEVVPVVVPPVVVPPALPEQRVVWGRWQAVNGLSSAFDYAGYRVSSERIALNGYFALFRTPGAEYVTPNNGAVGFTLRNSEVYVMTEYGGGYITTAPAQLSNGIMNIDFGKRSFATSMDVITASDVVNMRGDGVVSADGRLTGAAGGRQGYLNLQGVLSNERGPSSGAATIFDGRLDGQRTVNGAATWR